MVVAVIHMLFIMATEALANAAIVKLGVVQVRVIRGCKGVRLLHEAVGLEHLDVNIVMQSIDIIQIMSIATPI